MQFKLDFGTMGEKGRPSKKLPLNRVIKSLLHFVNIINSKSLSPDLREEIIKKAKTYPEGALDHLYHNLDLVLEQCANKLKSESTIPVHVPTPPPVDEKVVKKETKKIVEHPVIKRQPLFDMPQINEMTKVEEQKKWTTMSPTEVKRQQEAEKEAKKPTEQPKKQMTLEEQKQMFRNLAQEVRGNPIESRE